MVFILSNRSISFLFALLALSTFHVSFGAPDDRKLAASLKNKDIPWKDLVRRLSKKAKLIKGSAKAFAKQCAPGLDKPMTERTEPIFDAKSGLCLDTISCAFKGCLPGANHSLTANANLYNMYSSTVEDFEEWMDPSNPDYALPASVLFPKTAGDIVAAVEFANANRLELSIKSSGHDYVSQSSKKDSLLLNTKRFQKYAATGIVECNPDAPSEVESDLSNQPCVLAVARKKEAYIRVATGESFHDLYGAVHNFNEAQEEYKYHVDGGFHPTVTPMGWTFQGGQAATAMGRFHGYGVDQVLLIEAVLPTGEFVRFGPTSFEDAEGFLVPKTIAVSGVCNQNPFDDEESWVWGPCAKDINFDDLWYAFRGGGGGTYGIATSLFLQLHEYKPLETVYWRPRHGFHKKHCDLDETDWNNGIHNIYIQFMLDFILEPEKVGVSPEDSAVCGSTIGEPSLICFGEGSADKYISAFKGVLDNQKENLLANGITEASIDAAGKCLEYKSRKSIDYFTFFNEKEESWDPEFEPGFMGPTPFGRAMDFGAFSQVSEDSFYNYFLYVVGFDDYDAYRDVWFQVTKNSDQEFEADLFYHSVGGVGNRYADDQMTSLPSTFRTAAFYTAVPFSFDIPSNWLQNGYMVQNHHGAHTWGPLKSDNVTQCPLKELTLDEADEQCYSLQEATWGPERLARLEKIKATVDPNHILNCYKCVGYKKDSIAEFKPSKKKTKKSGKSRRAVMV